MPYKKRIAVYVYDEKIYKAIKHKCVDEALSMSDFIHKLLMRYMDNGDKDLIAPKTQTIVPETPEVKGPVEDSEAEYWQNEAKTFDNTMPHYPQPKKAPKIEPVEKSIKF